jgi:hypothetical protein
VNEGEEFCVRPVKPFGGGRPWVRRTRASGCTDLTAAIRNFLHPQLSELWKQHRALTGLTMETIPTIDSSGEVYKSRLDELADKYTRLGSRFVPLINQNYGLSCALDILLLRREQPGRVVMQSGDIDNRIKTLFDGLRMPTTVEEAGPLDAAANPFFCLLESDTLIDEVHVVTDMLLIPHNRLQEKNHVRAVIAVETRTVNAELSYIEFDLL